MNPPAKLRKPDWNAYLEEISSRKLESFYHYTPIKNLPQILSAGGIYSRHQARLRNIQPIEIHGWGDKWKELEDYICLSLVPPRWMLDKSTEQYLALAIQPYVAGYQGTLFSLRSSASIEVNVVVLKSQDTIDDFVRLFRNPDEPNPKNRLSEILVEDFIPISDIQAIYLPTWKGNIRYFWVWLFKKWSNFPRYGFSYPPLFVDPNKKLF
ncbi:MAG: DUF4433 domain-containing protein [bacterium]|nr:DUF4433 domain-containing protein [bacterium]